MRTGPGLIILLLLLAVPALFGSACGSAGTARPENNAAPASPSPPAQTVDLTQLKQQAVEFGAATIGGDFEKQADYGYSKVVQAAGGREKWIVLLRQKLAKAREGGMNIQSMKPGDITQTALVDGEWYAIVPYELTIAGPSGKAVGRSSSVAISADQGRTWKFIDAVTPAQFKAAFPKAAEKIQVPAQQPVEIIRN